MTLSEMVDDAQLSPRVLAGTQTCTGIKYLAFCSEGEHTNHHTTIASTQTIDIRTEILTQINVTKIDFHNWALKQFWYNLLLWKGMKKRKKSENPYDTVTRYISKNLLKKIFLLSYTSVYFDGFCR